MPDPLDEPGDLPLPICGWQTVPWGPPGFRSLGVVERFDACPSRDSGAHRGYAVLHRDAVRAGVGSEIRIEGPVLLHDEDEVLELALRQRTLWGAGALQATDVTTMSTVTMSILVLFTRSP